MFFSLSPIISPLIEDNVIRRRGPARGSAAAAAAACSVERAVLLESRRCVFVCVCGYLNTLELG